MPKVTYPPLNTIEGQFGLGTADSGADWTLTTARRTYNVRVVSYSTLSTTEKRGLIIRTADGVHVMSLDYIRKYTKAGMRVNCPKVGSWKSEAQAIEELTRHEVATFEQRESRPVVSLRELARRGQAGAA